MEIFLETFVDRQLIKRVEKPSINGLDVHSTLRSLPHRDSNSVKQNQNLVCYHYTMGQMRAQRYEKILTSPNFLSKIFSKNPFFALN